MGRVEVGRAFSGTPLTKQHGLLLARNKKTARIPWDDFDVGRYPAEALALAADAQRALALGEYTAVDLFSRLASALTLNGAPLDLVSATVRIPQDEIRHADLAMRLFEIYLPSEKIRFSFEQKSVTPSWGELPSVEWLDGMMLQVSAVGETLAAALLGACGELAKDPLPKAVFGAIVADEIHHARIGWYYLAWRAPRWSPVERRRMIGATAAALRDVEVFFAHGRDATKAARGAARDLGVLDTARQRKVIREVVEAEILPGLDALGLEGTAAWEARVRLAG